MLTADDYEHIRLERLRICSSPDFREMQSRSSSGRKWYNNGSKSIFVRDIPGGFELGRCESDRKAIGATSVGRCVNKGKH